MQKRPPHTIKNWKREAPARTTVHFSDRALPGIDRWDKAQIELCIEKPLTQLSLFHSPKRPEIYTEKTK